MSVMGNAPCAEPRFSITANVAIIVVCGLVAAIALSRATKSTPAAVPALPADPVSLQGSPTDGLTTARIALIEYSDFECPYSRRFANETLPKIRTMYVRSGKLLLAFRHLPLVAVHKMASAAAAVAACAGRQGRFWEAHDALFETPLGPSGLQLLPSKLELDRKAFANCLESADAEVRSDLDGAGRLGIGGTPTFLLGMIQNGGTVVIRRRLDGALPFEKFRAVIDSLLDGAEALRLPVP